MQPSKIVEDSSAQLPDGGGDGSGEEDETAEESSAPDGSGSSDESSASDGSDTSDESSVSGEDTENRGEVTPGADETVADSQTPSAEDTEGSFVYRTQDRVKVKGIYVTGPSAGHSRFDTLLQLVDETELNAMVIDIKNDAGEITYKMNHEMASSMGATVNYIRDIEGFMQKLKEHNVYTIARIVCFRDPKLAAARPDLGLIKADGNVFTDKGIAWVNPYKTEVWEYIVSVCKEAARIGFDEIQFDYVRFPTGKAVDTAQFGVDTSVYTKEQVIADFLAYAVEELHKDNIPVTADVYGTIIGNERDGATVGQNYDVLGGTIDAICPMIYPSHYNNGVFGLAVPDAQPYETILAALTKSVEDLSAIPAEEQAVVRPWLQDFTASWVKGHINYGGEQIRAQIQAVYDAGYEEWILWNSGNKYSKDGLLPEGQ